MTYDKGKGMTNSDKIEEYFGVKLLKYQKNFIDNIPKEPLLCCVKPRRDVFLDGLLLIRYIKYKK